MRLRPVRFAVLALSLGAAGSLPAGCAPAWTVVKSAPGNPLAGARGFVVEPVTAPASGIVVDGHRTGRCCPGAKAEELSAVPKERQPVADAYLKALAAGPGGLSLAPASGSAAPGSYLVRSTWTSLDEGAFGAVYAAPTRLEFTVQVVAPGGAVVDEVRFRAHRDADYFHADEAGRERDAAVQLASEVRSYLESRARR